MAANDPDSRLEASPQGRAGCLTPTATRERVEEEVSRAERYGTGLSCLLLVIENLEEMAREHGGELREQTLEYVAGALRRELRRFDRVGCCARGGGSELVIVLPGADGARGEMVARRALERLRTIKVEAGGARRELQVSVGLAAWRADVSAQELLALARAAVGAGDGENGHWRPDGGAAHERGAAAQRATAERERTAEHERAATERERGAASGRYAGE